MKTNFLIAFRNVIRQKRRSLVTGGAAAVGVAGILLYLSVMNGMLHEMIESALDLRLSSVVVEKSENGIYQPFRIRPEALEQVQELKGVKGVSPRILREALVTSANYSVDGGTRGIRLHGVQPGQERMVSSVEQMMGKARGSWLSDKFDSRRPEIVVGSALARRMKLQPGDSLILTIIRSVEEENREERSHNMRLLVFVAGIYHSSDDSYEKTNAYVHYDMIASNLGAIEAGQLHRLAIRTENGLEHSVKKRIQEVLGRGELQVKTWKEQDPFLASNLEVFDYMNYIFLVIVLLAASFVLINTMLMVVQERFREFGVLKAIGSSPLSIGLMIVLEGIFLTALGAAAGTLFSAPIVILFYFTGLNLGLFAEGLRSVGVPVELQPFWKFKDLILTGASILIFSFLGSLYPAIKAARIRILDAMHFN